MANVISLAEITSDAAVLPPLPADGHWPREADFIRWCTDVGPGMAAFLLLVGIIFLLWGYPIFRYLIMFNFGVVGAYLGASLGKTGDTALAGALIGGFLAAALAWPMMKWAVALTGAGIGTILGAAIWRASGQDPAFDWAGGLTGCVAFGMLSFIIFRGGIILYTSLQGGALLASGMLALLEKYPSVGPSLTEHLTAQRFLLPTAIVIPAVIGLIFQHHMSGPAPAGRLRSRAGNRLPRDIPANFCIPVKTAASSRIGLGLFHFVASINHCISVACEWWLGAPCLAQSLLN
jgi:hypothetical protein